MDGSIKILKSTEINIEKWNALVNDSKAPIYAQYHYLDGVCKTWKALVWNDYELILPIPYKTKFFIPYAYSVPFIQQLGFIGNLSIDFSTIKKAIKKIVRAGEIYANHTNSFLLQEKINIVQKLNLVLPLQQSYEQIQSNFSNDTLRNIGKANKQNFDYRDDIDIETCVNLYQENYGYKMQNIAQTDYLSFAKVCKYFAQKQQCFCRAVQYENDIVACAIILKDEHKLYNLANTTTAKGKKLSANYFLFNSLLKEFSLSNLALDFEGSEIAGVKKFYESFDAKPEPYFMWKL